MKVLTLVVTDQVHVENEEFVDLTDFQLKSFRYPI